MPPLVPDTFPNDFLSSTSDSSESDSEPEVFTDDEPLPPPTYESDDDDDMAPGSSILARPHRNRRGLNEQGDKYPRRRECAHRARHGTTTRRNATSSDVNLPVPPIKASVAACSGEDESEVSRPLTPPNSACRARWAAGRRRRQSSPARSHSRSRSPPPVTNFIRNLALLALSVR